jgi:arabinan endo-1,5-alpha-L-arabinosidase
MRYLSPYAILPLFLTFLGLSNLTGQTTPTFTNVSVHDPSVIKVGDRFYVFGSHGASAWSEDLMHWTQVATGVTQGNPPHFPQIASELSELLSWTQASTLWAADVYQLEDGKFYYYYNVWNNPSNLYRSYLGVAVSDHIEGPYRDWGPNLNDGLILRGGGSGFNPSIHPNTIDPTLYRSPDNRLWMVYGSYSGGMFVLEMDPVTGKQLPGQGWGTKLMGGNHALIEGPFTEYHPETGYYYLYVSYGGLAAQDGYQMRVFRSTSPTGPFFDAKGTNMSTVTTTSARSSIAPHGVKLAGNWRFDPVEGEPSALTTGYLSPGHNSVMRDPATGKLFNFFHTRFEGRGEIHEVRVHQMWFNEDGWPVMAPHRYAGETRGHYTTAEIAGSYKVINHQKDLPPAGTAVVHASTVIGLLGDGSLSGASGSWMMPDDQSIRLTLDGVTYKGVVSDFWDHENQFWVHGFTALSDDGTALWGSGLAVPKRPDELTPPDLAPIPNLAMRVGETLDLTLENRADPTGLYLQFSLEEGPGGASLDAASGQLSWTPLDADGGKLARFRIRAADAFEPEVADTVEFSVYVGATVQSSGLEHAFDTPATEGLRDNTGAFTGLTSRLGGTGGSLPANDPNLTLDHAQGRLLLRSTRSDFNGSAGLATGSIVGHRLSEFGFTGTEDFVVAVEFEPITGLEDIDQVGLFVGTNGTTLTRAGVIIWGGTTPTRYAVHTSGGTDTGLFLDEAGMNLSDGMTVVIARTDGVWSYQVEGLASNPPVGLAALDAASDLTFGVFAVHPLNTTSKTVGVKSLSVSIAGDEPALTRIRQWRELHFGPNPAEGVAGNDDDPDGDGQTNLLEYALGTHPMTWNPSPLPGPSVISGHLRWSLPRIDDPALIYRVQAGALLDGEPGSEIWMSAGESNLAGEATLEDPHPLDADTRRFLQLEIEIVED